jgi:antibiotic biosynthesis monooxygenase (ABM) superfamily enzyme
MERSGARMRTMDETISTDSDADTPVTTVIQHHPLPDAIDLYEAWLGEIIPVAQRYCGHQSVDVIRPHVAGGPYTILLRFDNAAHLKPWLDSPTRKELIAKIRPALRQPEQIEIKTGFEFWFTPPPSGKAAKPHKRFLVTLSAIFPLTILAPWLLAPVFANVPALGVFGVRHFVIAAIIVGLMVYVIMPRYTRLIARWLYR